MLNQLFFECADSFSDESCMQLASAALQLAMPICLGILHNADNASEVASDVSVHVQLLALLYRSDIAVNGLPHNRLLACGPNVQQLEMNPFSAEHYVSRSARQKSECLKAQLRRERARTVALDEIAGRTASTGTFGTAEWMVQHQFVAELLSAVDNLPDELKTLLQVALRNDPKSMRNLARTMDLDRGKLSRQLVQAHDQLRKHFHEKPLFAPKNE